jgi:hypothetical protein
MSLIKAKEIERLGVCIFDRWVGRFNEWDEAKEDKLYKKLRSKKYVTKRKTYAKLLYGGDEVNEAENGVSE